MKDKYTFVKLKKPSYPSDTPFHPNVLYPEYPFSKSCLSTKKNYVYQSIRKLFFKLGLDSANYGTKKWNPLKNMVKPGNQVLIKPNFVLHFNASGGSTESVITHGSVIRAVMDYVLIALKDKGNLIIADAPQMNADFSKIITINGMKAVKKFYLEKNKTNINIQLLDLRKEQTFYRHGIVWKRKKLPGDPSGYQIIDLKDKSFLNNLDLKNLYGADYHRTETLKAHTNGHHYYTICKTVLESDVVISVPKLKTHKKCGVTLNLKNMVGINGNKNHIVHYQRCFSKKPFKYITQKFDDKLRNILLGRNHHWGKYLFILWSYFFTKIKKLFKVSTKAFFDNWQGNDVVWRSVLDLNRILLFSTKNGTITESQQRKYFSIVDGVIAGEGNGPLSPIPKKTGLIIGGSNAILVDLLSSKLMGFDYKKIPMLNNGLKSDMVSTIPKISEISNYNFKEPPLWNLKN